MMSRESQRRGIRLLLALLGAVAVCAVAAGSAAAADPSRGYAAVQAVDPAGKTVTLNGVVYAVRPQTDFQNARGGRGRLRDLHVASAGLDAQLVEDADWVYFEAAHTPTGWVLTRLHVQEATPR